MVRILEFFAKNNNESLHVIVSTNYVDEYKFEIYKNTQLKELRTTPSITIATTYYQVELSRALEKKMQIIIL